MGADVTEQFAVFHSTEKHVNYRKILDYGVSSDQATGIKSVFLPSSKNGDYTDIIPQNPHKKFLTNQLSELALKISLVNLVNSFRKKNTNGMKNDQVIKASCKVCRINGVPK